MWVDGIDNVETPAEYKRRINSPVDSSPPLKKKRNPRKTSDGWLSRLFRDKWRPATGHSRYVWHHCRVGDLLEKFSTPRETFNFHYQVYCYGVDMTELDHDQETTFDNPYNYPSFLKANSSFSSRGGQELTNERDTKRSQRVGASWAPATGDQVKLMMKKMIQLSLNSAMFSRGPEKTNYAKNILRSFRFRTWAWMTTSRGKVLICSLVRASGSVCTRCAKTWDGPS